MCVGCNQTSEIKSVCQKCKGRKWLTIPEGRRPLNARESHLKPCNLCNANIMAEWMKDKK